MFNKILDVITPLAKGLMELFVWFVQEFWQGLKGIFDNLVVLAVVIPLVAGSVIYTKEQDKKIIKERQHTIDQLVYQVKVLKARKCR